KTAVDPTTAAVVEAAPGTGPHVESCAEDPASTARVVRRDADRVEVRVDAACAGLLVLSDQYYPGWDAEVNGRPASTYPTDVALRGVAVPAGRSTVTFRYRPSGFKWGLVIAALAIVALVAMALLHRRRSIPRVDARSS